MAEGGGMALNGTEFKWTKKSLRAVKLVADGKLTSDEIVADLKIGRRTLFNWKDNPEFQGAVDEIVRGAAEAVKAKGIADKQNRIDALNRRRELMDRVIAARAEKYISSCAGGDTGLLVGQTRGVGRGEDFQLVEDFSVDTALLKEMREHEKQAAIELGEWSEKREFTGKDGAPLTFVQLVQIADESNGSKGGTSEGAG